jgi:hypothetical protein
MEAILLGLVAIVCIYIVYSIFTKESFIDFLPQEENRLGKVATHIITPLNTDTLRNNPTGLVATVARPINTAAASTIQNTYQAALGKPNSGPRIDDTTSLLYLVDFCYQTGKTTNPFSDATFAQNCGMCMTNGSLLNGTGFSGSNGTGVVVYSEDKTYSLSQGIDAAPSSHSATCGPMVKLAGTDSNVTSLAINQDQYTATKAYMTSNEYTIVQGIGAGENTIRCTATSNGHPYVIKAGFSRDGAWDTHIAGSVDYTRKNLLTTTPIRSSCIEQTSCTIPSTYQQWDISAVCTYPKPTEITDLRIDDTKTTSTSLTFVWGGGLYADTYDYTLRNTANGSIVPGTSASFNSRSQTVTYKELTPATQYKFTLLIKNAAGTAPGSYTEGGAGSTGYVMGTTLDDRIPMTNIRFTGVSKTGFTVGWDGADNATEIHFVLTGGGSNLTARIPGQTKSYVYTGLSPGTTYTLSATSTYATAGSLTSGSYTQATLAAPVATPPPRPRQEGAVITSAQWANGSIQSGGSVDLSWIPPVPTSGAIINYRIYVSANPTTDATTVPLTPVEAIRFPNTSVRITAPSNKPYISVWTFISAIGIVESAYVQIREDPQAAERAAQPPRQDVYYNNGTVSCDRYCGGNPWEGPWNKELPVSWNGARCVATSQPSVGCGGIAGTQITCTCEKTGRGWPRW